MILPGGNAPDAVRPGEGVIVDFERLASIRDELRGGTYVIDDAQQSVREALADPEVSESEALDVLDLPPNKAFRNAYISILMEQVWPSYNERATGSDIGLYELQFDGTDPRLARQPAETTASLPLHGTADLIAASNQAMATYYGCELFSGGKVPEICGNTEIDGVYYAAFREQTELQVMRTNEYFKSIPRYMDSPSKFIASGLQVVRTYIFGIPNLIDGVSVAEGIRLAPAQHRAAVEATLARSMPPYYTLTGPLIVGLNARITDPETDCLLPDSWTSNCDPENYIVFPKPDIVRSVNAAFAQRDDLPVRTGCPVIHSRVSTPEAPGVVIPLPRALAQVALRQLDALYYPQRQKEYEQI